MIVFYFTHLETLRKDLYGVHPQNAPSAIDSPPERGCNTVDKLIQSLNAYLSTCSTPYGNVTSSKLLHS